MKKQLIATLVGTIILFLWQFLSWGPLNIHGAEMKHTPNQDAILEFLSQNLEDGEYFLPRAPEGSSAEVEQQAMQDALGKPWAQISYHSKMELNMGMNLLRGFVIDFVAVWLLVWILLQFAELNFMKTILSSLAIGGIGYFTIVYLNSIWYEGSTLGYIIDTIVTWGVVGVWLGWFLNRK